MNSNVNNIQKRGELVQARRRREREREKTNISEQTKYKS